MNLSSLTGIIAAMGVLAASILISSNNPEIFLDPHGILVVIGGTAAAALLCFPLRLYARVGKVFIGKFLRNYAVQYEIAINEIVDLARGSRDNSEYLKSKVNSIQTVFLKDAVLLMIQGGISDDALFEILSKRAETHSKRYEYDANVFKTIAKFPPAFGLMGTTLGMINLLQGLGGKDAQNLLGPAMAMGLVATFYGIVGANLIFIPIAENLTLLNREDETIRTIVIDGIRLLRAKEHPKVVEEYLKSYLLPNERNKIRSSSVSGSSRPV